MPFVVSNDVELTKNNIINRQLNFNTQIWLKISDQAKDLLAKMLNKDQK